MRPKAVFVILVIVECFLLILLISPGVMKPKSLVKAQIELLHSRSPAAEQKFHEEQIRARHRQYLICGGAVAVLFTMIGYGWSRKL